MGGFFDSQGDDDLFSTLAFGGFDTEGDILGQGIEQAGLLNPGQEQLLNSITGQLRGQTGNALTPFGGQRAGEVPFSQLQNQGFGLAGGFGQGAQQGLQAFGGFDPSSGQQFLGQAQGALQQGLQGLDPERILKALQPGRQFAENQFNQRTVPDLLERFGANSGSSGALNRAFAEAGQNLSLGLGAQAAPFLGQAALAAPGQQFQGAQLAGNLSGTSGQLAQQGFDLGSQGIGQLFGAGALQRSLPQGIAAANQARQQDATNIFGQFAGLGLGTNSVENIAFQGFRNPSQLEQAAPIAQAFGSAIGSDERIKDEIETIDNALGKIEELDGKTYHYIFKPESEKDAGLIAQDIEKVLPEAVIEVKGVKMVKYEAIIGLLVNANKELHDRVKQLERKVA